MPTPRTFAAFCDLAITFEEKNRKAVEDAFRNSGVKAAAIYRKQGDEYVKVVIDIPNKINNKQKELLEKFEKESKKKFGLF